MKIYYVYIISNYYKTVLYTGVTNNLSARLKEHYRESEQGKSFAGKYKCHYLLYYETFTNIQLAIAREKEIKGWKRVKKVALIDRQNPSWEFLADGTEPGLLRF